MVQHSSVSSVTFVLVAMFFCVLVCLPCESEAKSCVYQCMRNVITCKRKSALGGKEACCEAYFKCFLECKPDATKLPPCSSGVGKRNGWDTEGYRRLQPVFPNEYMGL